MFFPVRHDRPLRSTPWLTMALIVANMVVYVLTARAVAQAETAQIETGLGPADLWAAFPVTRFYLWPVGGGFEWRQLASCAFLHADFMHLAFNMLFLWIFGGAVEDRLGKAGFLALYAAGAAASGGLFLATGPDVPMLGASGAIAAVTGAFFVLFPRVRVMVVMWFLLLHWFEVPATLVLLFYFGLDLVSFLTKQGGGVAHAAHLGGFLLGFLVAAGLLATKILKREPQWDLLALFQHWRRRKRFQEISREGGGPWLHGRPAAAKTANATPPLLLARREGIFHFIRKSQLQEAAAAYAALLADHPDQVLPEQIQHDLAALLMQNGAHAEAAQAFRLLLAHHPRRADRAETQLLLALLCARYLDRQEEAQILLKEAVGKLEGADKALAESLLKQ